MNATLRVALLAGAVLAVTACQTTDEQSGADTRFESERFDDARPAAISVRAGGCNPSDDIGSGSMIDADLAVTAAHVVAGADEIDVVGADGATRSADVVMFDPDLDLAVLRTSDPIGAPLIIGPPAEADDQAVIVTVRGTDDDPDVVTARVRVERTVNIDTTDIYLEGDVTRPGFEVVADIESGDSGAVVVLPGGRAGGMIWAKSTERMDRAWAIDLPAELGDADVRASLIDAVDTGACTS